MQAYAFSVVGTPRDPEELEAKAGPVQLDVDNLLATLEERPREHAGLPEGTIMGHVHLRVADVEDTVAFYRDALGFGLMAQLGAQAAFLAAGGYHHHIGANTWESAGSAPPPAGSAALRHLTIRLPDTGERDRLAERLAMVLVA